MPLRAENDRSLRIVIRGVALLLVLLLAGTWWGRSRISFDPLAQGHEAYARGEWDRAASLARERLRIRRDDTLAFRLLARASARSGRDEAARALYAQIEPGQMTADDRYLVGLMLFRAGDRKGCIEVWQQALEANPDHAETLHDLARLYQEIGRFGDAAGAAGRLSRIPRWRARGLSLQGIIKLSENDPASAAASLQSALELEPAEAGEDRTPEATRKLLARALLCAGRPREARDELRALLTNESNNPDHAEAWWLLSRAYLQEGALHEAREVLAKSGGFADADPTQPDPAPFIGSDRCAGCHAGKFHDQRSSRHARTFRRATELADLNVPSAPLPDPATAQVTHTFQRSRDRLEQIARTPDAVYQAVIEYAFGSGDRGLTLVGREASGVPCELRLSLYRQGNRLIWDVTTGQPQRPAIGLGFLGRPLTDDGVRLCVSCHVTNPRTVLEETGPEAVDHAIGCERCHGPGGNHVLAVAATFPEPAIGRPSLASGARVVQLCAQCHSPRGMTVSRDDPASVRFQGTTLTWSRCYAESEGKLDCVTCHDPHRDAATDRSYYEAKCLSCHGGGTITRGFERHKPIHLSESLPRTACSINPASGCISCHMPAVKAPMAHSGFTDHFIRVHRDP